MDGISRGVITELSQLLGQQVAYWRFKNAVTIVIRAQRFLESKGLKPQDLSAELRVIVPLIESASYEDEAKLQKMWSSLLAASISPEFDSSMHPNIAKCLNKSLPSRPAFYMTCTYLIKRVFSGCMQICRIRNESSVYQQKSFRSPLLISRG